MTQLPPTSGLYGIPSAVNVTAVLGPTNTGKTHLAIERMLGHQSGLIGLPLRLLAREVYDRVVARIGPADVALITGEEKIKPKNARYWISTVEAMPRDIDVEFVAIDEVQLAADLERGHVFTDRIFHARGSQETLLLGAETIKDALGQLLPGVNFISRPRLSKLSYAGPKKISRLPRRSAIVAFSAHDVYELAEFVRRQRGGAAVVLGALSPRTRNAQVEMFESGDVDFLVATDAVGMGLNLDVHHVAFAGSRKFDGNTHRDLFPHEIAQIAGRAGRHLNDGTFGVTRDIPAFSSELINRVEAHEFDPIGALQWRSGKLDFASIARLLASLKQGPGQPFLMQARDSDDVKALEVLSSDKTIVDMTSGAHNTKRLWEVCQVPDYRKIGTQDHSDLVKQLFFFLMRDEEQIPEDWISAQIDQHNRIDGDIDTLANRIAHIRTWTFIANRLDWLADPAYWQEKTRKIEDMLSDALHEGLTKRFVDQRTSTLMKRLREKEDLLVEIDDQEQLHVEDHFVGKISGFQFTLDDESSKVNGRAARAAAVKVLAKELTMRSKEMIAAEMAEFSCAPNGDLLWKNAIVGRLQKGDHILKPKVVLLADEQLSGAPREETEAKLQQVVDTLISERLTPLVKMHEASDLSGLARGVAFQLVETLGTLLREPIAQDIRQLDQDARGQLRKYGVRFGAFNIFVPLMLKPAASELRQMLWLLFHEKTDQAGRWVLPRVGLTSAAHDKTVETDYYRAAGYHVCEGRVVRVDMLERLADLIRPLISWRTPKPPKESVAAKDTLCEKGSNLVQDNVAHNSLDQSETGHSKTGQAETGLDDKTTQTLTESAKEDKTTEPVCADVSRSPLETKVETKSETTTKKPDVKPEDKSREKSVKKPQDKRSSASKTCPEGASGDGGFTIVPDMMSIMGCSADELSMVLRSVGYRATIKKVPVKVDLADQASKEPVQEDLNSKEGTGISDGAEDAIDDPLDKAVAKEDASEPTVEEIVIWRPRTKIGQRRRTPHNRAGADPKTGQQARGNEARKQGKSDGKGAERHNKHSSKKGPKKGFKKDHGRGEKKPHGPKIYSSAPSKLKKVDPDSPFAKLQALKEKIEDKAG